MSCAFHQLKEQYWTPSNIFAAAFVFSWLSFLWGVYLSFRQYRVYVNNTKVPPELKEHLDQVTVDKSRLYNIDKSRYSFIYGFWSQLLTTALFLLDVLPFAWNLSAELLQKSGVQQVTEIPQTLTFLTLCSVVSLFLDLPWNLYYTFVLEEKHGFNKYTLGFYFWDKVKKFFVMNAISFLIIGLTIKIILVGGDYFFVYLWVFCSVVVLLLATIYPDFIAPLFDKYVPLPESQLKTQIEKMTSALKYPLSQVYIVEGSKRSSHSNAYLYGMFNRKKIVLYDTLIDKSVLDLTDLFKSKSDAKQTKKETGKEETEPLVNDGEKTSTTDSSQTKETNEEGCTESEILAVLGHELGHWKLSHIVKNLLITELNMFFAFAVFGLLYKNQDVYSAFGFTDQRPIFIGLFIIFEYIFSPYNEVFSFLMTSLTRRFEFQADAFAKQLGRAEELKKALIKLNKTNLSFPMNDWLYSTFNHSHPPLIERINALGKTE